MLGFGWVGRGPLLLPEPLLELLEPLPELALQLPEPLYFKGLKDQKPPTRFSTNFKTQLEQGGWASCLG